MSDTRKGGEIRLVRRSDSYWRVTFDLPPLNIFGPANIPQLEAIVSSIESDEAVKVVPQVPRVCSPCRICLPG